MWCQRKSLKCFCSHNSRREVRREQTPFVDHNKGLAKLPTLVVIPGHALNKNTKKNPSEEKENLIFFCGLLMRFMTYSISESGTPGQSCGKRNTNTKERGHCWSAGDILFTIPRKVVSFFVTTYRGNEQKGPFLS